MTRIWPVLLIAGCALAADVKPPAQAARGQAFFLDETNAKHCGTCHSLAKQGTAVGPDLSKLARLGPRAILMAVRATSHRVRAEREIEEWQGVSRNAGSAGCHDGAVL